MKLSLFFIGFFTILLNLTNRHDVVVFAGHQNKNYLKTNSLGNSSKKLLNRFDSLKHFDDLEKLEIDEFVDFIAKESATEKESEEKRSGGKTARAMDERGKTARAMDEKVEEEERKTKKDKGKTVRATDEEVRETKKDKGKTVRATDEEVRETKKDKGKTVRATDEEVRETKKDKEKTVRATDEEVRETKKDKGKIVRATDEEVRETKKDKGKTVSATDEEVRETKKDKGKTVRATDEEVRETKKDKGKTVRATDEEVRETKKDKGKTVRATDEEVRETKKDKGKTVRATDEEVRETKKDKGKTVRATDEEVRETKKDKGKTVRATDEEVRETKKDKGKTVRAMNEEDDSENAEEMLKNEIKKFKSILKKLYEEREQRALLSPKGLSKVKSYDDSLKNEQFDQIKNNCERRRRYRVTKFKNANKISLSKLLLMAIVSFLGLYGERMVEEEKCQYIDQLVAESGMFLPGPKKPAEMTYEHWKIHLEDEQIEEAVDCECQFFFG
ncbi:hypothetical protein GPALN_002126 [Globodera pallida]|nr:hypothetical protein GPALN_002126 [Globodera pallida]